MNMLENLADHKCDPILSMFETYKNDSRPKKVNLGLGIYLDKNGKLPVLKAVAAAEQYMRSKTLKPSMYLPMEGHESYRLNAQRLQFGYQSMALADERIATIQTLGGSGALRIGAEFLRQLVPDSEIWVSDPTWENHISIFENVGFKVFKYPYLSSSAIKLDFEKMLETLNTVRPNSVILLHPCCHNPTGLDLTESQWMQIIQVLIRRDLIAFLDFAYQGFGEGLEADSFALRELERAELNFIVSYSFSKNFSLYGERVGTLSIVCPSRAIANKSLNQLKFIVRRHYSSPPQYGAQLVDLVLGSELAVVWRNELEAMRIRISSMRELLSNTLTSNCTELGQRISSHKGMFSYTSLSKPEVLKLRNEFGIYINDDGRLCLAGLTQENIYYVSSAVAEVYKKDAC